MTNFELLENAGFEEFQSTEIPTLWWINVGSRMAFNFEGVRDADFRWLDDLIRQQVKSGNFLFYFAYGTTMDGDLCALILALLGKEDLSPVQQLISSAK
jgi:hypothetical protein